MAFVHQEELPLSHSPSIEPGYVRGFPGRDEAQVNECWCLDEAVKRELVAFGSPDGAIWWCGSLGISKVTINKLKLHLSFLKMNKRPRLRILKKLSSRNI